MKTFPDLPSAVPEDPLIVLNPEGFDIPVQNNLLIQLFKTIQKRENIKFKKVEVVYVDEPEIVRINKQFLGKDYVTDTISFRYDEDDDQAIEGTLYECAPRIINQSKEFETEPTTEFYRIFVHGLLHLTGYDDQTLEQKETMNQLEDQYLQTIQSSL